MILYCKNILEILINKCIFTRAVLAFSILIFYSNLKRYNVYIKMENTEQQSRRVCQRSCNWLVSSWQRNQSIARALTHDSYISLNAYFNLYCTDSYFTHWKLWNVEIHYIYILAKKILRIMLTFSIKVVKVNRTRIWRC